jgi:hypothetical protein
MSLYSYISFLVFRCKAVDPDPVGIICRIRIGSGTHDLQIRIRIRSLILIISTKCETVGTFFQKISRNCPKY